MPPDRNSRRADVTTVELVGGTEKRDLVLADYDPNWPGWYDSHERRIATALGTDVPNADRLPGRAPTEYDRFRWVYWMTISDAWPDGRV